MQVTQVNQSDKDDFSIGHRFTQEQLWQEFRYIQAEKVTRGLLEKGLITLEEYERIMAENRRSFPTYLAPSVYQEFTINATWNGGRVDTTMSMLSATARS